MVKVTCFGGAGSVTGSNYLVETSGGSKVLVDCGLFQGGREMEQRNRGQWGYDPKNIDTLILTHAHIDHSGRIPKLVKDGFRGRIITSPPTAELCEIMLLDSAHVQEMEAEWQSRKKRRQARKGLQPLYTTADAEESLKLLVPTELNQVIDIEPGIRARLRNAGHILGSSIVELWIEDEGKTTKIVFSGDLGKRDQLIVKDPEEVFEADYLFIESTYGNRLHRSFEESKAELLEAIRYAYSHDEKVIIPAFAVERTQEVLYILGEFSRAGEIPNIPIFLDSPLAIKATQIFIENRKYFDEEAREIVAAGGDPFNIPNLKLTASANDSMKINQLKESAIIISANGMCTAGRIKHHLKHNLWRAGASIVIVGFQAQGSTGRQIVDGAKNVTIFGEKIAVRAKIFTIGGLSSHADRDDLLEWVGNFTQKSSPQVFVIHGEPVSSADLAKTIREQLNLETYVPRWRETLRLEPGEWTPEKFPEAPVVDVRHNMLVVAAELEAELSELREHLVDTEKEISDSEVSALANIRDQLRALMSK